MTASRSRPMPAARVWRPGRPRIAEAVRVVAAGEAILFPAALGRVVAARPRGSAEALPRAALTVREGEVLRLMATGLSNPEIAGLCRVSLETVKTHVGNVLTKLGARRTAPTRWSSRTNRAWWCRGSRADSRGHARITRTGRFRSRAPRVRTARPSPSASRRHPCPK